MVRKKFCSTLAVFVGDVGVVRVAEANDGPAASQIVQSGVWDVGLVHGALLLVGRLADGLQDARAGAEGLADGALEQVGGPVSVGVRRRQDAFANPVADGLVCDSQGKRPSKPRLTPLVR